MPPDSCVVSTDRHSAQRASGRSMQTAHEEAMLLSTLTAQACAVLESVAVVPSHTDTRVSRARSLASSPLEKVQGINGALVPEVRSLTSFPLL